MSLTLYGAPLSPFVRKVRLLLAEKGLDYQLEAIAPFGQPAWYREISPLGRIPALRDGDLALADSSVICQYLEERYPEPPNLQGDAPRQPRSGALAGKIRRLRDRSPGHADDLPQPDTQAGDGPGLRGERRVARWRKSCQRTSITWKTISTAGPSSSASD